MGILDNLENAWDVEFQFESTPIKAIDNTGLALKIFTETCCDGCSCKSESDHKPEMLADEEVWNI
jgi:hypothetical protein